MRARPITRLTRQFSWTTGVVLIGFTLLMGAGCQVAPATVDVNDMPPETVDVQPDEPQSETPKQNQSAQSVSESASAAPEETASETTPVEVSVEAAENEVEGADQGQGPKIVLKSSVFDFGEAPPTISVKGKFEFRNEGQGILEIINIRKCCGADVSLKKKKLAAGEEAVMDVTYHFSAIGPLEKQLYLDTNDPNTPLVKLTIKGNVVRKLAWTPQRLKLFLDIDNAGCPDITVKSLDEKPFAIKSFTCTADCIDLAFDPNVEAKEYRLQPKVDIDTLEGMARPQGIMHVQHTHPGCDDISLNFDLLQRYSHRPPRFLIFNADPAVSLKPRTLHIQDNYAETARQTSPTETPVAAVFEIESVVCTNGTAVLRETSPIPAGYSLSFDIVSPKPDGNRYFKDEVVIKIKGETKEIRVSVDGYYSQKVIQQAIKEQQAAMEQSAKEQGSN